MSNPNGGVYWSDEPRHGDLGRRLSGVMTVVEASALVAGVDARIRGHMDMVYALTVIGDAAAGAAASTEDVGVVAGNGDFDERRKELKPRWNLNDSSHLEEVGNWAKETQKKQAY